MSIFAERAIDLHAHFTTPAYRASLADAGFANPDGFPSGFPAWHGPATLELMDEIGIETAYLSITSPGVGLTDDVAATVRLARRVNDEGADIARDSAGRFRLMASIPWPDLDASIAEIRRCLDDLDAAGFVMLTNYAGRYLGEPELNPVMAELNERQAIVAIHPTSPACWEATSLGRPRPLYEFHFDTTRAVLNLVLNGVLDDYPEITWVVPHCGAAIPSVADRVARSVVTMAGLQGGTPPPDVIGGLRRLYYDIAGGTFPRQLPSLAALVGTDHLVYGSDFPFTGRDRVVEFARDFNESAAITGDVRNAIIRGNALTLLNARRPGEQPAL